MSKHFLFALIILSYLINSFLLKADDNTYINSNNITYDEKKNLIELSENSKINFNDINVLIDKGIIDYNSNTFEVFGNFYLYENLNILSGKNLKGDTNLNSFTGSEVSYIYNNDLKIDSKNIKRLNNKIYFYDNFLTPCELEGYFNCPTWSLRIDKTEYDIEKDQFKHYDSFLQIADYKVFYTPYLSHFGSKAPRHKGFLNPTINFEIGNNGSITAPYYIPLRKNTDILISPNFILSEDSDLFENFEIKTSINHLRSGGNVNVEVFNKVIEDDSNIYTSAKLNTKQIITKNTIFKSNLLLTNSISTSRSINDEPITFEDLYVRIDKYNLINSNDYTKFELSSVESFDAANASSIPLSPSITFNNFTNLNNKFENYNQIDIRTLKRNESSISSPSENLSAKAYNEFSFYPSINKKHQAQLNFTLINNFYSYSFEHDQSLNREESKSSYILSLDNRITLNNFIKPRFKIIHFKDLYNSNDIINEDSNSISFNYQNIFSDNRFFGTDLSDKASRIVFGIENKLNFEKFDYNFKIGQFYEINKDSNYSQLINQTSGLSDFSIEANAQYENIIFKIDSRLDKDTLNKKEMNYSLNLNNPLNLSLIYNETDKDAFLNKSNDTQNLGFAVSKKINNNISISFKSDLDLKNNFSPYSESLSLNIFDECSNLNIVYSNTRFNDNFNTTPEEKISLTYQMDYLGFFGYEQSTDLFFKEFGKFENNVSNN